MPRRFVMALSALLVLSPLSPWAENTPVRSHVFQVSGMTCALCAKSIDKALRNVTGVRDAEVNREMERVRVIVTDDVDPARLEDAIESAGPFEAHLLEDG